MSSTASEAPGAGSEARGAGSEARGAASEARGAGSEARGAGSEAPGAGSEARGAGSEIHGVAPGVALRLSAPAGARDTPAEALPAIDVSAIAGARVTLRRGVDADGLSLRAVCATAPSRQWVTGLEELVIDRATGLVRGALGASIERWEAEPIRAVGHRFEQAFEGAGQAGERAVAIRGRHALGFAGDAHDAALCSVVCMEPAQAAGGRCGELLAATGLEGALVAPPEPGVLAQAIFAGAEHPGAAIAGVGVLGAAGVAVLLARRPRPRPSSSQPPR